jgi:hypothetical protein
MLFDGRKINDTSFSNDTAPDGTAWRQLMQRKTQASFRFVVAPEVHFTDPPGHGAVAQHLHGSPHYHPRASGVAIVPCNLSSLALKYLDCSGVKLTCLYTALKHLLLVFPRHLLIYSSHYNPQTSNLPSLLPFTARKRRGSVYVLVLKDKTSRGEAEVYSRSSAMPVECSINRTLERGKRMIAAVVNSLFGKLIQTRRNSEWKPGLRAQALSMHSIAWRALMTG